MTTRRRIRVARLLPAILLGGALLAGGCGDDGKTGTTTSSSSSSSTSGTGGTGGGTGGVGGMGGAGGMGGMSAESLWVGVGKQKITPTIVESVWDDANGNGYFDAGESFTDTNGNGTFDATWLAGFGTGRPATGINDDPEVRAIAFKKGDTTVVVCILDAIGYFIDDMDMIRADPKVVELGVDHLLIGSTHVHDAVDTIGLWGPAQGMTGYNAEYQKLTRDQAAKAIAAAVESLKPARMRVAQVQTVDPVTGSTKAYVNDVRDPIIYDPTLTIAQFTDEANPTVTIASLVNWSSHPEYAGSENNLVSADNVHWLRETIEKGLPEKNVTGIGGTMVFVQGALGGQVGPGGGVGPIGPDGTPITQYGLPRAQAAGTNVALLALSSLATSGEDTTDTTLLVRDKEVYAQVENAGYHFLRDLGVFNRQFYMYDPMTPIGPGNIPSLRSQISYLQVGPMAMITAPGELHPELWVGGYDGSWSFGQNILNETENAPDLMAAPQGPYLREIMLQNPGVKYPFVGGCVQDFLGYIVPAFNYVLDPNNPYFVEASGDHYEETNSIGPKCEEQLQHPMMDVAKAP